MPIHRALDTNMAWVTSGRFALLSLESINILNPKILILVQRQRDEEDNRVLGLSGQKTTLLPQPSIYNMKLFLECFDFLYDKYRFAGRRIPFSVSNTRRLLESKAVKVSFFSEGLRVAWMKGWHFAENRQVACNFQRC